MKLCHYVKTINSGEITHIANLHFILAVIVFCRMSVKNVLWRSFIPYCTDSMLCDPTCRWNRLRVVSSLVSEVFDRTQSILKAVNDVLCRTLLHHIYVVVINFVGTNS